MCMVWYGRPLNGSETGNPKALNSTHSDTHTHTHTHTYTHLDEGDGKDGDARADGRHQVQPELQHPHAVR
jgi:hypothetical protein